MDGINLCRGQVVVVSLEPTKGREQKGTRPCVIVQNDVGNKNREVTIIVPLTADRGKKIWPFMAKVHKGEGGLKKNSIALCSQIRVVDMERVEDVLGIISPEVMGGIDSALKRSLALP